MADDKLPKKMPIWTSGMWPQNFEGKNKTHIGGIGSARHYPPTLRDRFADVLFGIYGSAPEERYRTHNIMNFANFLGAPAFDPYDTTRAVGEGRFRDAIAPGISVAAPFLGKPTKLLADAIRRRHSLGQGTDNLSNSNLPELAPNLGKTSGGHVTAPTEPQIVRTARGIHPPNVPQEIDFTVPAMPWERSSPWVAPHPPLPRPQRDFALDYPNGAVADKAGNLLLDMDGNPLTAKNIAGRRTLGGKDQGITPREVYSTLTNDLNATILSVPRNGLIRGAVGQVALPPGLPPEIRFWGDMPQDQVDTTIGHEFGHVLEGIGGEISTANIEDELNLLYSELATGRAGPPLWLPQHRGYLPSMVPREKAAEAIRAYTHYPNAIKTIAPNAAARLRKYNKHPFFSKYIQFNGIPLGTAVGAGAITMMGQDDPSQATEAVLQSNQLTPGFNGSIPNAKNNIRKIASALRARHLTGPGGRASFGSPR